MHLNYDCVRDVLMKLEDLLTCEYKNDCFYFNQVNIHQLYESLSDKGYSIEDVLYAVQNLEQSGLIKANLTYASNKLVFCLISAVTAQGNEFISKIQSDDVWSRIKSSIAKVGSFSLPIISNVATSLITSLAKSYLGLP